MSASLAADRLPLKYVTTLITRGTAPDYSEDGRVRVVGQAANQWSGINWTNTRLHVQNGPVSRLKGYLQACDVLVNSTGTGTLGRVGYFTNSPDGRECIADGHVTVVRADPRYMDPRYLYYQLSSRHFYDYVYSSLVVGSTNQIELNRDKLMSAPIRIPALDEQRRIADFLDAETSRIDRLIATQRTVSSLLVERGQALIDSLVEELRDEFDQAPLRRSIRRIEQGSSPQCDNVEAGPGEWGVLKVSAVKSGRFEPGENKHLPDRESPLKQYEIKDGDLLVTRANTPLLVGATAVAHQPPPRLLLCDKIFRIDLDPSLDKDFVALVARSTRIRAMCAEASHGTSQSMANLKTDDVKGWPMPAAPLDAQRGALQRIAADSDAIVRLQGHILSQLRVLAERRQALISVAVTGQLDVTTARGAEVP